MSAPDPATPAAIESILTEWLTDPDAILVCGRWDDGAVAEILPRGRARLTPASYEGRFAGLRDLVIDGQDHHMHLDLAKYRGVRYVVRPSVCFGFRPALEVDLVSGDGGSSFAVAAGKTWTGKRLAVESSRAFFRRFAAHRARFGDLVEFLVRPSSQPVERVAADWAAIDACLWDALGRARPEPFDHADPLAALRASGAHLLEAAHA